MGRQSIDGLHLVILKIGGWSRMAILAVTGAQCTCSFGTTPCMLQVTSQLSNMADKKPIATIQDMKPGENILGFGMCTSMLNPTVAAATAAALGVLTPQPCTMVPAGTWIPTNPSIQVASIPCLTNESTLLCGFGSGTIKIMNPGQKSVLL